MKKAYRVNFVTKKNGYKKRVIDIEANTVKEAKEIARDLWYKDHNAHMFQIEARVLKDDEELLYNYFS